MHKTNNVLAWGAAILLLMQWNGKLVWSAATSFNSDFSVEFLQGLTHKNGKTQAKAVPLTNSLEYVWLHQPEKPVSTEDVDSRCYELYLKTEYEIHSNRAIQADSLSKILSDLNPPVPAHAARARLLFESGKFFELIQLPFFAQIEHSGDWESMLMGARAYEMIGMLSKSEKLFDKAMEKHADKDQLVYHRVMLEIKRNNISKAEQIIDSFLQGNNAKSRYGVFYQLKAVINLQKSPANLIAALDAINNSVTLNSRSEKAWKIRLVILEQLKAQGKPVANADLVETYKQICALTGDADLKKAIIDKLFKMGLFQLAYQELSQLDEKTAEHDFDLALLSFREKRYSQALRHIEKSCAQKPLNLKNVLLKLEILAQVDAHQCVEYAATLFEKNAYKKVVRKVFLQLLAKGKDTNGILNLLMQDRREHPKNFEALVCLADAFLFSGHYHHSFALYQKAEDCLQDHKNNKGLLMPRLGYNLCLTAFLTQQYQYCKTRLAELLPFAATMPEIYHLKSLVLTQEQKYDKALQNIHAALLKSPYNSSFLTALNTILLHSGKLYQAQKIGHALSLQQTLRPNESGGALFYQL